MLYLLFFHGNSVPANTPQYYVHMYIVSLPCPVLIFVPLLPNFIS